MTPDSFFAQERPINIASSLLVNEDKSQIVYDTFTKYSESEDVWSGNQNRTMFVEFKTNCLYLLQLSLF